MKWYGVAHVHKVHALACSHTPLLGTLAVPTLHNHQSTSQELLLCLRHKCFIFVLLADEYAFSNMRIVLQSIRDWLIDWLNDFLLRITPAFLLQNVTRQSLELSESTETVIALEDSWWCKEPRPSFSQQPSCYVQSLKQGVTLSAVLTALRWGKRLALVEGSLSSQAFRGHWHGTYQKLRYLTLDMQCTVDY